MKIIHTADLHLDSAIDSLPPEKGRIRRDEIVRTFERLCEYAADNGVNAVIIAGDAFDGARVTKKTAGRFIEAIKNCEKTDFLYLAGNHDDENFIQSAESGLPVNLKLFGKEWTTFDYGDVAITGVTLDKYNSRFVYDNLKLDADKVNIVCLHGKTLGYKNEEEAEAVSLPLMKNKNADYLALGHYHSYERGVIDGRGVYAYCGCPDGRGFDETGVKGFVLLESDGKKITDKFIPFCSRVFCAEEYSVEGEESFYSLRNRILRELSEKYSETSLVKVVLTGAHSADWTVDAEDLAARLNERFFFGKVYDRTSLKVTEDDFAHDKSVRGEFVRAVMSSDLSEDEKNAVIRTGLSALKGEL